MEGEQVLDGAQAGDQTTNDTTASSVQDMSDDQLSAALQAVRDANQQSEAVSEPASTQEPAATAVQQDPATVEPPKEPDKTAADIDAEVEKRLQERMQAKLAEKETEFAKRLAEERQRTADAVIAKERKREESAVRKLRDLEAAHGMPFEKIVEANRAKQIEVLQAEEGISEERAREIVLLREEQALARSRKADMEREHQEKVQETTYEREKLLWMSDKETDPFDKAMVMKYAAEIDAFSDMGKQVTFDVARDFIMGKHRKEIADELRREAESKVAAAKADAEAREKAAEQRAIRNLQQHAKAAPETSTAGTAPKEAAITEEQRRLAKQYGVDPTAVAKTAAQLQRIRGKR